MSALFENNNNNNISLEVEQNAINKLTASNRRFFAAKVHKLKKMLKSVLKLLSASRGGEGSCQQDTTVCCATTAVEDIQNAMNEALEARLSGDARPCKPSDDALQAIVNGDIRLIAIRCDGTATRVPLHFVCSIPSADNDIRAQGDLYPISFYQEAEQQAPHNHSHLY